jgi:hypothetical protein
LLGLGLGLLGLGLTRPLTRTLRLIQTLPLIQTPPLADPDLVCVLARGARADELG